MFIKQFIKSLKNLFKKVKTRLKRNKFPIKVYVPNKEHRNINSHWERVIIRGPFAYGIDIPKRDCKCRITYNIDPNQLTPETYEEINPQLVPLRVYIFLKKKVLKDLQKMEDMKKNITNNIKFVKWYASFADKRISQWRTLFTPNYDIEEFTLEDERKEKEMEMEKYKTLNANRNNQQNLNRMKAKNSQNRTKKK